jgi:hypothetical protein
VDPIVIERELVDQSPPAVLAVNDDGIHPPIQLALGTQLAGPGLSWQHVVRSQYERPSGRQQMQVQWLERQPLEVDHLCGFGSSAVAEHVGYVLAQLQ